MSELELLPMCCGNCTHWRQDEARPHSGKCRYAVDDPQFAPLATLDLSLCTKWQAKGGEPQ